jgi:hypothetical protein
MRSRISRSGAPRTEAAQPSRKVMPRKSDLPEGAMLTARRVSAESMERGCAMPSCITRSPKLKINS